MGDKEFWDRWRTDTIIQTAKGERVLKDFPEEVKTVMDDIFRRQGEAYERIYATHGAEILARMTRDGAHRGRERGTTGSSGSLSKTERSS